MKKNTSTALKKTSLAALTRILNGKSNPFDKEGFYFTDTATGKFGVTDSYCAVMYDTYTIVKFPTDETPHHTVNISKLFEPFNNEFHEWYSDDRTENILVKDIIESQKAVKKNKNDDSMWYCQIKYGIRYNINMMRDVCEALDCKEVGVYYPFSVYDTKYMKPIVIISENGMGLIMPLR